MEAKLWLDTKHMLGEGPTWDHEHGRFIWVDILGKTLLSYEMESQQIQSWSFNEYVTAAVPINKHEIVLAMHNGICIFNMRTEELAALAAPLNNLDIRFNDGKCDAAGRFWIGTMGMQAKKGDGALYCINPDGHVSEKISGVTISNGIAWNAENDEMYYIDSPTKKIASYDFNLETGDIKFREYVISIPDGQGVPDGMTIDEEGMLWIAHYGGWKVSRWNPQTGEQLDEVKVPCSNVTSCTFGGKDMNELFITTARQGLNEEDLKEQREAGSVFRVETKVRGRVPFNFSPA